MKKLSAVLMMVLALGMGKAALADQDATTWTLHGFYVQPGVEAFIPFNEDLDTTVFIGGKVGYQWNEWFALEINTGWAEADLTGDAGDVTTIPLLFNARVNLWPGVYMVDPYVFGGLGVAFNDIEVAGVSGVDIDNSLAGQIGAGAEYHINESLSAALELSFYFNNPDLNVPVLGEEDVELNAFLVGGNVTWRF